MQIQLTSEQSSQFSQLAAFEGRNVEELTNEALSRFLSAEARYIAGVLEAEAELDRGESHTPEQVREMLARFLK